MKSNIIKRGVAGLLSLVMCISTFVGIGRSTLSSAFSGDIWASVVIIIKRVLNFV